MAGSDELAGNAPSPGEAIWCSSPAGPSTANGAACLAAQPPFRAELASCCPIDNSLAQSTPEKQYAPQPAEWLAGDTGGILLCLQISKLQQRAQMA